MNAGDKLTSDKIQQLLSALGTACREDESVPADVRDYAWRRPRYFNLEQFAKVKQFAQAVAEACTEEFARLYKSECSVRLISATERYSYEFDDTNSESQNHYFSFGATGQKLSGLLMVPNQTALLWTGQVLGDSTAQTTDRKLSKLEESFLLDIAYDLINAFCRAYGGELLPTGITNEWSALELHNSRELLDINFEAGRSNSTENGGKASFLLCCDKLESIAGKSAPEAKKLTDAQISAAILEHVHQFPLSVSVRLSTSKLTFKDVMDLQANDIVVLNKKLTDTVDVLVEDKTLFRGRPAQSGGNYAVVIV